MRWKCVCLCVCVRVYLLQGVLARHLMQSESHPGPWISLAQRDVRPLKKPDLKTRSYVSIIFHAKKAQRSQCPNANISPTFITQIYSNIKVKYKKLTIQELIKPFTVHGDNVQ